MRKMNEIEMQNVNAGAKVTKSAKCGWCGKKYSVTLSYSKWVPFHKWYVSHLATIGAQDKAYECALNDGTNALK